MRVRCFICAQVFEVDRKAFDPAGRCPGCGTAKSLRERAEVRRVGDGPIVGPASVPCKLGPVPKLAAQLERQLMAARTDDGGSVRGRATRPAGRVARISE